MPKGNVALIPAENNQPEPVNNTELVRVFAEQGGKLLHLRPRQLHNGTWTRGMTVAFKVKGGRVELATAVQHRNDTFTKKLGTRTAIEHFNAGKTVHFPMRSNKSNVLSDLSYALDLFTH